MRRPWQLQARHELSDWRIVGQFATEARAKEMASRYMSAPQRASHQVRVVNRDAPVGVGVVRANDKQGDAT